MSKKVVNLFEFPTNLGLKKKETEIEPGVKLLPEWLKKHRFHELVQPLQTFSLIPPVYTLEMDELSGVRNAEKIIRYACSQSEILLPHFKPDTFNIIIGGDCSILIGTAMALKKNGNYGLFFLDGHTDFVLPAFSSTGGAAGMDLAIVTGNGHEKLTNIGQLKPYLKEENIWCVGNREYDEAYEKPIIDSAINYFDLNSLRETGLTNCTRQFLEMVDSNKLDGFFIHLDLDVLNDEIMPAVDCRQEDGLSYAELTTLLELLISSPQAAGIEITILDPNLDQTGKYTTDFVTHLTSILERSL